VDTPPERRRSRTDRAVRYTTAVDACREHTRCTRCVYGRGAGGGASRHCRRQRHRSAGADRIRANELLLAYGYGKPAATQTPDEYDGLEVDEMTAEAVCIVDELARRRDREAGC